MPAHVACYCATLGVAPATLGSANVSLSGSIEAHASASANLTVTNNGKDRNQQVAERDAAVREAIQKFGRRRFSGPDIAKITDMDGRRIKRALETLVEEGKLKVMVKGYKRKPTLYRRIVTVE